MASDVVVGWALSVLKHLPSKNPVTAETVAFYALGLEELTDDQVKVATRLAARDCTFLPSPAELAKLVGAHRVVFDVEPILDAIRALGSYLPTSGTTHARVERVREALGDGIAEAYSCAGGARMFSGNETTRDIAQREFAEALRDVVRLRGRETVLAPVEARRALPSPSVVIYGERPKLSGPQPIQKLLTRGEG